MRLLAYPLFGSVGSGVLIGLVVAFSSPPDAVARALVVTIAVAIAVAHGAIVGLGAAFGQFLGEDRGRSKAATYLGLLLGAFVVGVMVYVPFAIWLAPAAVGVAFLVGAIGGLGMTGAGWAFTTILQRRLDRHAARQCAVDDG